MHKRERGACSTIYSARCGNGSKTSDTILHTIGSCTLPLSADAVLANK